MLEGTNATVSTQRRGESPTGLEIWDENAPNILENQRVFLEQLSPDMAASLDGQFTFEMYRVYFDGAVDIQEGDTVTDEQSRVFTVQGVEKFTSPEIPNHTEAVLALKATNES